VIFVVLLILFSNLSSAKVLDVPEVTKGEPRSSSGVIRYVYSGNNIVASLENEGIEYYHQDRLSTRLTTNENGEKVGEFLSLPFGQKVVNENVNYPFTGKEEDESSLYYFGARYYDSDLGRFTSVDPVTENHPYSYVDNNPIGYYDPDGMALVSKEVREDLMGVVSNTEVWSASIRGNSFSQPSRKTPGTIGNTLNYLASSRSGYQFVNFNFDEIFAGRDFKLEEWEASVEENAREKLPGLACAGYCFYLLNEFAKEKKMTYDLIFERESGESFVKYSGAVTNYELKGGFYHATIDPNKVDTRWFQGAILGSTYALGLNTHYISENIKKELGWEEYDKRVHSGTMLLRPYVNSIGGHVFVILRPQDEVQEEN